MQPRLLQLDLLRGVAILLTVAFHMIDLPGKVQASPAGSAVNFLRDMGWVGVDLFLVLSGFLVSGLIFKEFRKHGGFKLDRFLIRRGFKIYPGFYLCLFLQLPLVEKPITLSRMLVEMCYLQNYFRGLRKYTWSLAVEEHFYITLGLLCLLLTARYRRLQAMVPICAAAMLLPFVFRVMMWLLVPFQLGVHTVQTHLRCDALAFGVLLSYFHHFHTERLEQFVQKHKRWLAPLGVLLVLPCVIFGRSDWFTYTIGLTALYVGIGCFLLLTLFWNPPKNALMCALGNIGFYSYSIFLWNIPARNLVELMPYFPIPFYASLKVVLYWALSLSLGILMARLVEIPFLKLRDRLYPSRSQDGAGPTAVNVSVAAENPT